MRYEPRDLMRSKIDRSIVSIAPLKVSRTRHPQLRNRLKSGPPANMSLIRNLLKSFLLLMAVGSTLAACHTKQPPVTPELLAGSYSYVSMDPERRLTDYDINHLVLQSNGRYDLIEGGTTKAISEKKGVWRVVPGNPPNVLLDQAGYPIDMKGNEVRLLIDLDVGVWWVKTK